MDVWCLAADEEGEGCWEKRGNADVAIQSDEGLLCNKKKPHFRLKFSVKRKDNKSGRLFKEAKKMLLCYIFICKYGLITIFILLYVLYMRLMFGLYFTLLSTWDQFRNFWGNSDSKH